MKFINFNTNKCQFYNSFYMYTTKDFQISFIFTVKKKYILFSEKKLYSYVLPKWKSDVHIGISKLISITTYKFHFYLNLLNLKIILKILKYI